MVFIFQEHTVTELSFGSRLIKFEPKFKQFLNKKTSFAKLKNAPNRALYLNKFLIFKLDNELKLKLKLTRNAPILMNKTLNLYKIGRSNSSDTYICVKSAIKIAKNAIIRIFNFKLFITLAAPSKIEN